MGFLDKMKNKIENNVADKIVDKMFGKQKKEAEDEVIKAQQEQIIAQQEIIAAQAQAQSNSNAEVQSANVQGRATTMEDVEMMRAANAMNPEQMSQAMGIMYNTKRCPNCQAVCMNSPVECPYCHADLKNVKPMTPEEMEKL